MWRFGSGSDIAKKQTKQPSPYQQTSEILLDQRVSSSLKPWPSLVKLIYSHRGHLCWCSTYSEPAAAAATTLLNKYFSHLMSTVQGQFNQAK